MHSSQRRRGSRDFQRLEIDRRKKPGAAGRYTHRQAAEKIRTAIRNFRFFVHVFPSRFFMPRKGAEVAESVEPLIFTTFRFIPRMKRCHGFMEEENGGSWMFPRQQFLCNLCASAWKCFSSLAFLHFKRILSADERRSTQIRITTCQNL
jgi:hypothetical protein